MAMSSQPRTTPRDAHCEEREGSVGHLLCYSTLGSYRAAAGLCGTTPKTVRRVVERRSRPAAERPARPRNTDPLTALMAEKVRATDGWISAKRPLPACRAAGYRGSACNLRRAVAFIPASGGGLHGRQPPSPRRSDPK